MTGTEDAERARDRISMEAVKFKSQRADALPPSAKTRSWDFLPKCNENAPVRMRVCAACSSHFYRAKFIPQLIRDGEQSVPQNPAMTPDLFEQESNMINKLLGAAAMAAVAYAVVPASAAKTEGCSGGNLTKTESMIETMADGEGKIMAQKEVAQAQDAMLNGKMGVCAVHLSKAMHAGMPK